MGIKYSKKNNTKIDKILFKKGCNFTIDLTNNNMEIKYPENNIKIDRILLESQNDIISYIEYSKEINDKFKKIKQNVSELKQKSLEIEITELLNSEIEKNNLLKNELKFKRQKNTNYYENLKKKLEAQYENIEENSKQDFENFRTKLFNSIYNILFDIDYQKGGMFSSDKYIVSMKEFDKKKVKQVLNNSFTDFYKKILKDAKKLLESIDIELDENTYEIILIDFIKKTYVEASLDSLYAIYYLWKNKETENYSEIKKDLKIAIDLAIADERIYAITLAFLQKIYNDIESDIENKINDQNDIINQLLENISKL